MKYFTVACLLAFATVAYAHCKGCVIELHGHDLEMAEKSLEVCLSKVAEVNGPIYKLVKLNSAKRQYLGGTKTFANATLEDENKNNKICNITIWSDPSLVNNTEVTLRCPDEKKVIVKYHA